MTALFRHSIYRPTLAPSSHVPLGARSAGHYRLAAGERDGVMKKHFTQFFWSVEGRGKMLLEGRDETVLPGQLAFYLPGDLHDLGADEASDWEYRWWTMDGPLAPRLVETFGFERGQVYNVGEVPAELLEQLAERIRDVSYNGEILASAVAYELLCLAAAAARPAATGEAGGHGGDFTEAAMQCLHARWNDSAFGVEQLAEELGMDRSVLTRRFQKAFGVAPSEYLQRWRVQNALSLLKGSGMPIREVARACGWEDANYFARCIRRSTGVSPVKFREL